MEVTKILVHQCRDFILEWGNLLQFESHDHVNWEVSDPLGLVAQGSSAREGKDIRDRSTDELEGMSLKASCKRSNI